MVHKKDMREVKTRGNYGKEAMMVGFPSEGRSQRTDIVGTDGTTGKRIVM